MPTRPQERVLDDVIGLVVGTGVASGHPPQAGPMSSDDFRERGVIAVDVGVDETAVVAALGQFDDLWRALIPAEQARIVQLLVARITVSEAGLAIDLRHDGLGAIAALMAPPRKEVA